MESTISNSTTCSANSRRLQVANPLGGGPNRIAITEGIGCRTKTVENIRGRLVTSGFEQTLEGKPREKAPRTKVLDGKQEAQVIAMRLGPRPKGFATWSLRLLAEQAVELEIVDSISHETVRQTLKKTQ